MGQCLVAASGLLGKHGAHGGDTALADLSSLRAYPQPRRQMVYEVEGELLTPLVCRCRCHTVTLTGGCYEVPWACAVLGRVKLFWLGSAVFVCFPSYAAAVRVTL